ncbi:unnamed protein product, partial [Ixodes persulcatus]
MYHPRSKKRLLRYDSSHSKHVKRGIVSNCLSMALNKSCEHRAKSSFESQVTRLKASGYPFQVLTDIAEKLLTKNKISHNMKKIASTFDVLVVISAPDKLKRMCPKINNVKQQHHDCDINHKHRYVNCNSGVVYKIPFTCGNVYIGQTGRCINTRLREHALTLKSTPSGHLAMHVRDCSCTPLLSDTKVMRRFKDKRNRE